MRDAVFFLDVTDADEPELTDKSADSVSRSGRILPTLGPR